VADLQYIEDGGVAKLLLEANSDMLTADPKCCCGQFFIQLVDINRVRDDDLKLVLNGNNLGNFVSGYTDCTPGNPFLLPWGRYYATTTEISPSDQVVGATIDPASQATALITPAMLITGVNTIVVESVTAHGCGNHLIMNVGTAVRNDFGQWVYKKVYTLTPGNSPGSRFITFPSVVGNSVTTTFEYP
jgi:hypothetical protein